MLATLNHPAIPIFDDSTDGNRSYLVLEFVPGQNLQQWLDETDEYLDEQKALDWALQVCEALAYLHSQKPQPIVFRDLKPSNIMLDSYNHIRLIDFGIAKLFEATEDKGTMIGTAGYTPPEQYRGEATPAAHVYGLGATLHHLLTRQDPRQETPFTFSVVADPRRQPVHFPRFRGHHYALSGLRPQGSFPRRDGPARGAARPVTERSRRGRPGFSAPLDSRKVAGALTKRSARARRRPRSRRALAKSNHCGSFAARTRFAPARPLPKVSSSPEPMITTSMPDGRQG